MFNSFVTTDGVRWYAFRMDEGGYIWPLSHSEWYASPTIEGARSVSRQFNTRKSAVQACRRSGYKYGGCCRWLTD